MSRLSLTLQTSLGGVLADLSRRVTACTVVEDAHGDAELTATVTMPSLAEQFRYYDREGDLRLVVSDGGRTVYHGRLTAPKVAGGELQLEAHGRWTTLDDVRYTALWSETRIKEVWRVLGQRELSFAYDDRFNFTLDNQIYISPKLNISYGTSPVVLGTIAYEIPSGSSRLIRNIAFDYAIVIPSNSWHAGLVVADDVQNTGASTIWETFTTGMSGTVCLGGFAKAVVRFFLYRTVGPNTVYTSDDGTDYFRVTNVRLTTMPLLVDATMTANLFAGGTSVTVSNTTNMTAGLEVILYNDISGGGRGERATILSVVGSTVTFTAPVASTYTGAVAVVRAQRVLSSDVAADLAAATASVNSAALSASGARVATTTTDRRTLQYEDASPARILDDLAFLEGYRAAVLDGALSFAPASGQVWHLDVSAIEVTRQLDPVRNAWKAAYKNASDRTVRSSTSSDLTSQRKWGTVRQAVVSLDTTDAAEVALLLAVRLANSAAPAPQVRVTVRAVTTPTGMRTDPTFIRAGDTVIIRNLARNLTSAIDQLTSFRVARRSFDTQTGALALEAETPPDTFEVLLAQIEAAR